MATFSCLECEAPYECNLYSDRAIWYEHGLCSFECLQNESKRILKRLRRGYVDKEMDRISQ